MNKKVTRMAFKLFKSGDDLYEDSKELIRRGEFSKARDYLVKSINKEGGMDDVAAVQVALIDLKDNLTSSVYYEKLIKALADLKSTRSFEFGLDTIDADRLAVEANLTLRKIDLLSSRNESGAERSKKLQALAQDFQSEVGSNGLTLNTLFVKDATVTGNSEFYNLMALSYEILSDSVIFEDIQQAAEYQQIAAGYRQQNGQSTEENMRKVREYSKTCTCWICGRVANGQGINFFSAPAEAPNTLKDSSTAAASSREDVKHIYICRACYSAVSNRADEISKRYYDDAMQQMAAMEMRLEAQIAALQTQISYARMNH